MFSCKVSPSVLWTAVLAVVVGAASANPVSTTANSTALPLKNNPLLCSTVRHALMSEKGFGEIPREPIPGQILKVCSGDFNMTCCTAKMETALASKTRQSFDETLNSALVGKLSTVLQTRATKFNEFFMDLLTKSKREFHEMFKKTYGIIYEQNQAVFTDLFENLESYFVRGRTRLDRALEKFFNNLYQKMFKVINGQYNFDDKYMDCVSNHMTELRPFGDAPHKLSLQVKRSFVATRTFGQALLIASQVAADMTQVLPPPDCSHALTKMSGCNVCQGRPNAKACAGFCTNVMRGCLAYHSELDIDWNSFVEAFSKISDRLLGPFNIEVVVEPINIKISEAIMNFQENGYQVSEKVFAGCGKPRLGKRSPGDQKEIHYETLNFGKNNARSRGPPSSDLTPLEKLINDTLFKVKDTKNFWSLLPLQMCNNEDLAATPKQENNCWNGHAKSRYEEMVVMGSGIASQADNPEVKVSLSDSSRHSSKLSEQMYKLRMLVSKLRSAFNGQDVDWGDDEEDDDDGPYGGQGSGSGYSPIASSGDGGRHGGTGPIDQEGSGEDSYEHSNHPFVPSIGRPQSTAEPPSPTGRSPTTSAAPPTPQKASVTKAVVTYLFPIVVVWLGGMFSDW